jgi:CBS domain-containing protein
VITVRDIFQKKENVIDAPADMTIQEAIKLCGEKGVSRLPVRNMDDGKMNEVWNGVFSLYDMIFAIPENEWKKRRIGDCATPITSIQLTATMESVLLAAKNSESPLLAVNSLDGTSKKQVGIVSRSDVVKRLFG